jgi:hypothetical protein
MPATPGLGGEPAGELHPGAVARVAAGPQLDGHGEPAALARGGSDRHGAVGVVEQRRAGAGPADLAHRAAHVQVDQVGARGRRDGGRLAHHVGVVAEQLHRNRVLVRMDPQELAMRAGVAVD